MYSTIIQAIGFIITGIIITLLFSFVRSLIVSRAKKVIQNTKPPFQNSHTSVPLNSSVGKVYKVGEEPFNLKKFIQGLNIFNLKLWAKSLTFLFRYFLIFAVIAGVIYGYGWWKGRQASPVEVILNYEEEWELRIPKHAERLYHPEESKKLYWINKKGDKTEITVGDMPELSKLLRPYGLEFTPIGVVGVGAGGESGVEGGAGVRFLRYYKWRTETFLTNRGIYLGVSYKLDGLNLDNSALGLGFGKGYAGDSRALLYFSIEF